MQTRHPSENEARARRLAASIVPSLARDPQTKEALRSFITDTNVEPRYESPLFQTSEIKNATSFLQEYARAGYPDFYDEQRLRIFLTWWLRHQTLRPLNDQQIDSAVEKIMTRGKLATMEMSAVAASPDNGTVQPEMAQAPSKQTKQGRKGISRALMAVLIGMALLVGVLAIVIIVAADRLQGVDADQILAIGAVAIGGSLALMTYAFLLRQLGFVFRVIRLVVLILLILGLGYLLIINDVDLTSLESYLP